jgi:LemA protein
MDSAQLAALAAAAVLVFWMVGAYNRLVALRNGIGSAYAQLDDAFKKRSEAVAPLIKQLHDSMPHERSAFDTLATSLSQHRSAADALKARPAAPVQALALAQAEAALASACSRVQALAEAAPAGDGQPSVVAQLNAWREADARIHFARQLFNDAVAAYNSAAQQFPTRLLLKMFGLSPAAAL